MNVSDYIFDFFSKKGVNTAFVITGGQAMFLDDALARNENYQCIFTMHEQAAAMSAEAYGRIKQKPAITLVTAGPGAVNAINGVVGGYTDSSPMIIISGHTNLAFVEYQKKTNIRQYGIQGINIGPLVSPVVKYFATVEDPRKLDVILGRAYDSTVQGRPGPVWIEVPLDMQKAQVDPDKMERYKSAPVEKYSGTARLAAKHTVEKLAEAKRPVFLVGQGVSLSDARAEFRKVVERFGIPVITARLGIDLIESEHELYVGRPGNYGERAANFAIQNADLIVSVGCRLASSLVGHTPKEFGKNAYKIVVDIDREELDKPGSVIQYKAQTDCKEFFNALLELDKPENDRAAWVAQCNKWKRDYPVVQPEYKLEERVNSYYFYDRLSALVPASTMVLLDTGSCFHAASQTWKVKKGQRFLTTGGISSMGYWVAGIGACIAHDRQHTIILTGDGSLQMNIQEFATIKHNRLPIKVFILNNNGYLLIRQTQRNFMENRFFGESPDTGVWCPDSLKIAEAYGIKAVRIHDVSEVDEKIKEVLEYDGPVICDVLSPEWQLLIPRISSDKLPDGTLVAHEYADMFPFLPREEYAENMKVGDSD